MSFDQLALFPPPRRDPAAERRMAFLRHTPAMANEQLLQRANRVAAILASRPTYVDAGVMASMEDEWEVLADELVRRGLRLSDYQEPSPVRARGWQPRPPAPEELGTPDDRVELTGAGREEIEGGPLEG